MDLHINIPEHRYGSLVVLNDIKFDVVSGEIVCVVGPSGCGKSTLLGIIGGLVEPASGEVRFSGQSHPDCLNPLTFVFQDFALLPWLSVKDNIAFVLKHHNLPRGVREARIRDVLARTGLSAFADAFPKQLSGGMRQRVGIARALVVKPAILLMDEPFSALDAQTREILMDDFLNLWLKERITAVHITHNLNEAIRLADRIVVMSRRPGRIKKIFTMAVPKHERDSPDRTVELLKVHDEIWSLIKDEAVHANEEMAYG
ncbi:ABC transporter ATP-binding protein [Rhizobium sp. 1AS11]|uniref:ABC transporter ATP-binding protein n=1 Tax=Rhizobium acaciae TaxID=2989736 RepID=UPI00222350AB|nr:ABC transporter ATP-binding protein [Rhizobium acaciae]MCW1411296.1 ABC transporter ATP-binding protein [Rhizobium acaciae]MCW1743292.1 ABC transporter ATP-binding protein [Rhizobium acaciae]